MVPAPKPLSIFTTDTLEAQELSMLRSAAIPLREVPYPTEVGTATTGRLVVQGQAPFHITAIRPSDPRFQCPLPTDAKKVHLIPVTFTPGNESGQVTARIEIATDENGFLVDSNGNSEGVGIFAAGCVKRPLDVSRSVKDGTAAVMKAIQVLRR